MEGPPGWQAVALAFIVLGVAGLLLMLWASRRG
jgi:hypothetical protein